MSVTDATATQQATKRPAKRRQPLSSAIPTSVQQQTKQPAMVLYSPSALDVDSSKFPLYKAFTLSQDSLEVFVKVDKNTIANTSTGQRYAAAGKGYLVNLIGQ
jgi:hypothetical protein